MTKSELLKKLIKEACLEAIREELPKMLKENVQPVEKKSKIKEAVEDMYGVPLTLNQPKTSKSKQMPFNSNDPISSLLNETFISMTSDDAMQFGSSMGDQHPSMVFQPAVDKVGTVQDMLSTARGAGSIEAVTVNAVPDFNGLMDKLLQQGDIK
jgi:hypothetical protein